MCMLEMNDHKACKAQRKGGTRIFLGLKRGGPEFFPVGKRGDQKKICDQPSQTDGPLPLKNDSSLMQSANGLTNQLNDLSIFSQ